MMASTAASMAPVSVTWRRPRPSTMTLGAWPVSIIASKTCLASAPDSVLSASRSSSSPRCSAVTGGSLMSRLRRLRAAKKSPVTQLAATLASRPFATVSKKVAVSRSMVSTWAS